MHTKAKLNKNILPIHLPSCVPVHPSQGRLNTESGRNCFHLGYRFAKTCLPDWLNSEQESFSRQPAEAALAIWFFAFGLSVHHKLLEHLPNKEKDQLFSLGGKMTKGGFNRDLHYFAWRGEKWIEINFFPISSF